MLFQQLFDKISCTYTYLIAANNSKEALLIDPVHDNIHLYAELLKTLGLSLVFTLETHTHADHITAAAALRKRFHSKIIMGRESDAEFIDIKVKEGDNIRIGDISLEAIHTPGHTNDSYCYRMEDRIFTGDTLLIRGTGRTDFQNGNPYHQYDSIFNKILTLPESVQIYPGHDYRGMLSSTIAEEKQFNPRLQVSSAKEYATIMNHLNLPKPTLFDIAVPANLKCGLME